jgi:hypothetical protein
MNHGRQTAGLVFTCCVVIALAVSLPAQTAAPAANDVSGMYTFLREGEFVELAVDDGQPTGFISRFGDTESDKGEFIDHFFDKVTVQGNQVHFTTKTVHAVWYEFDGTFSTVAGKQKGEDGYQVLAGKLTVHKSDATGKEQASERTVTFKSFPDRQHLRN